MGISDAIYSFYTNSFIAYPLDIVFCHSSPMGLVVSEEGEIYYTTALKGCQGIVFTHGVWMGWTSMVGRRESLSGRYLRKHKV